MQMGFLLNIKRHQHYFYISIFLVGLFFVIIGLITSKITDVTEELVVEVIREKHVAQQNALSFEINALDLYMTDVENTFSNGLSSDQLVSRLGLISELTLTNEKIVNSWVMVFQKGELIDKFSSRILGAEEWAGIALEAEALMALTMKSTINKIVRTDSSTLERKMIMGKSTKGDVIIFGYDVDLIRFWEYYSQNYYSRGGYNVLFNGDGICMLHPDPKYIGQAIEFYFEEVSIQDVLNNEEGSKGIFPFIQIQAVSEYLGLEVMRYYSVIETNRKHDVIQVASFPIQINIEESLLDTKRYFYWIGLLTLVTFIMILGLSRFQLKREFVKNRVTEKEKEHLKLMNEKYQRENAVLQLRRLKRKMNPHFLFNALNSLIMLIETNPELSQEFVLKLSEVYRYLLKDRQGNLITVKEEMEFLQQYIFLQKIRFSTSLNVSILYEDGGMSMTKSIPLLALETLVENAIKHNEITKTNPLYIEIKVKEDQIVVSNNYNPRAVADSHHLGLEYLKNSYEYYEVSTFRARVVGDQYICCLPLLTV